VLLKQTERVFCEMGLVSLNVIQMNFLLQWVETEALALAPNVTQRRPCGAGTCVTKDSGLSVTSAGNDSYL
jgi:hypothetical protein